MAITPEQIKTLRDQTGISVMQCKKALEEADGDMDRALAILAEKSGDIAKKKLDRELAAGVVSSYIHGGGQVGVLVLLSCETDFVAKNEEFVALARDIAMHAAATRPLYIRREEAPQDGADHSAEILLDQPFIKDDSKTIQGLIDAAVQKFGERTEVSKLSVFAVK